MRASDVYNIIITEENGMIILRYYGIGGTLLDTKTVARVTPDLLNSLARIYKLAQIEDFR